jgi:hypothetical protein
MASGSTGSENVMAKNARIDQVGGMNAGARLIAKTTT